MAGSFSRAHVPIESNFCGCSLCSLEMEERQNKRRIFSVVLCEVGDVEWNQSLATREAQRWAVAHVTGARFLPGEVLATAGHFSHDPASACGADVAYHISSCKTVLEHSLMRSCPVEGLHFTCHVSHEVKGLQLEACVFLAAVSRLTHGYDNLTLTGLG